MTEILKVSGLLSEKDVRRLTRLTRGGAVGPTAVYYAGVTAPIISASMSMMVREAMKNVGLSSYWQWFIASMVAAIAGIVWYLVFIRWSYRHKLGRGTETTLETTISLDDEGLSVFRGPIKTFVGWEAVKQVKVSRNHTAVDIHGADALIIPNTWFDTDKTTRKAFQSQLIEKSPN